MIRYPSAPSSSDNFALLFASSILPPTPEYTGTLPLTVLTVRSTSVLYSSSFKLVYSPAPQAGNTACKPPSTKNSTFLTNASVSISPFDFIGVTGKPKIPFGDVLFIVYSPHILLYIITL